MNNIKQISNYINIKIFDVGHGDSILLEFPNGKDIAIIDCHLNNYDDPYMIKGPNKIIPKVAKYLKDIIKSGRNICVPFICVSHYHYDHYYGLVQVINMLKKEGIKIDEYWDCGAALKKFRSLKHHAKVRKRLDFRDKAEELAKLFFELDFKSEKSSIKPNYLVKPQKNIRTIDGVSIDVIAPDPLHWYEYIEKLISWEMIQSLEEHKVCSALIITYGKGKILLSSDISNDARKMVIKNIGKNEVASDVIKLSHHGSREGNVLQLDDGNSIWRYLSIPNKTIAVNSGGYRSDISMIETIKEIKKYSVILYSTGLRNENYIDPVQRSHIPSDVVSHIMEDSKPIFTSGDSYHGDIEILMDNKGKLTVNTQYNREAI